MDKTHTHTHTHTHRIYSATKKDEMMPFAATWDGLRDYHTKGSKSDRERQISSDIAYMWSLKFDAN